MKKSSFHPNFRTLNFQPISEANTKQTESKLGANIFPTRSISEVNSKSLDPIENASSKNFF
jgi:hypothetical protein